MGKRFTGQLGPFGAIAIITFLVTGCPNNQGPNSTKVTTASSTGIAAAGSGDGVTDNAFLTVTKVVLSNQDPNSLIELIGQNNEIGTQCPTKTSCECMFNWTTQDPQNPSNTGIPREAPQALDRVETNMARCLFTQVDSNAKYYDVKLHIIQGDQYSNSIRVFQTTPNPSLDPSIAGNYTQVQRYMCRDMFGKANNTQKYTNLVDPALWGAKYSFAYNFYTTSFGKDYGATATTNADGSSTDSSGYECPVIPNDPSEGYYNLNLISQDPIDLSNPTAVNVQPGHGDNTIYPSDDNQFLAPAKCTTGKESTCEKFIANRHDFYLATFHSGIFKTPVCIVHKVGNFVSGNLACDFDTDKGAVTLNSAALGTKGQDIIGFAAVPDSNQNCPNPNLVSLPDGKKWAKVWQFRLSRGPRTIKDVANPQDVGQLFCTTKGKECVGSDIVNLGGLPLLDPNSVCQFPRTNNNNVFGTSLVPTTGSTGIGPQQVPPGYGNCDTQGFAGDGAATGLPFDNDATFSYEGMKCNNNAGSPAGTSNFNCCLDVNQFNGQTDPLVNQTKPANFTLGGDFCNPAITGTNNAALDGGLAQDIWLMGNGNKRACIEADTNVQGAIKNASIDIGATVGQQKPVYTLSDRPLETNSRFDRVYVISPTNVTIEQMQDPEHNPVARKYQPILVNNNGSFPYELELGTQLVAPSQSRLSQYPLCVLQDSKQGANP